MTSNTELLDSLKNILMTSYDYPDRGTDCLSHVISKEAKVEGTCRNISCHDYIFFAVNYEQTITLINDATNFIKLKELIE